jgi:hypothetical protein
VGLASDPDGYFCAVEEGRIRGSRPRSAAGPRWPIYRLDGGAAAVARLKARVGLDPREQELPSDPGAAERLTAEVFGHGRADDLAHWRGDGGVEVAIERGGEFAAFAYRRGEQIGPAAGRGATRRRSSKRQVLGLG